MIQVLQAPFSCSVLARTHCRACLLVLAMLSVGNTPAATAATLQLPVTHVVEDDRIRLSQVLRQEKVAPAFNESYRLGLTVLSQQEAVLQAREHKELLDKLKERSLQAASDPNGALRLYRLVQGLPLLGRLPLKSTDPYWLEFNLPHDPWLRRGDSLFFPAEPQEVVVLLGSGEACRLPHAVELLAGDYVRACNKTFVGSAAWLPFGRLETYWLAQPDGQVFQVKESAWAEEHEKEQGQEQEKQSPPAPGAWVWAPGERLGFDPEFSNNLIKLLASQGPAGSNAKLLQGLPLVSPKLLPEPKPNSALYAEPLTITANDWGSPGYLQMPSARIQEGAIRLTFSQVEPAYKRYSLMLSPLPWLEFSFRYNRRMDSSGVYWSQGLDKNVDAKFRLVQEGPYIPEVSIGLLDGGGTGLFTSEYLVASKRYGNFDFSLGAAFGYLAGSGGVTNPVSYLSSRFKTRQQTDFGLGGKPSPSSWFTGPMGIFAGVQWQTPYDKLLLKAELDSNDYKAEPTIRSLEQKTPINFGLVYRPLHWTEFSLGLERGNTAQLGMSLLLDASKPGPLKTLDPSVSSVYSRQLSRVGSPVQGPLHFTDSQRLSKGIEDVTLWKVQSVEIESDIATVMVVSAQGYFQERLARANRYLNLALPPSVHTVHYRVVPFGLAVSQVVVDRRELASGLNEYRSQRQESESPTFQANAPSLETQGEDERQGQPFAWRWGDVSVAPGLAYGQVLGTPENFWMYHLSASARLVWNFRQDTWLQGQALYRLSDNLQDMRGPGGSFALPLVRTNAKSYYLTNRATLKHLQLTHTGSLHALGQGHFYSTYAGYFERMFGGVGAEYLYRPYGSSLAFGVDMNYVGQREFEQDLRFQDYRVATGHATMYWDTGYRGVRVKTMFGRYLAKDVGATLELSRTFSNGFTMGAWATKTNVSAEEFGEGSFDKGIYFSFPFDAVIPKTTNLAASFMWRPTTRDGGAILSRRSKLHTITSQGRQALNTDELIGLD